MSNGGSDHPVEVEWQFDALDLRPVERWLLALQREREDRRLTGEEASPETRGSSNRSAGPLRVSALPGETRHLLDTYLDTDDWRVGRAGYVLRIREKGGRAEVTLKDTAPATGGLRRRLEVTEPLADGDISGLGDRGPVGRRVAALVGARPLRTVLEVRTVRRPYSIHVFNGRDDDQSGGVASVPGRPIGEIALDDTELAVGHHEEPARLRRVEVEVDPSWVERLEPFVDRLKRECGLSPASLSKFEAGILAAGLKVPGPPDLGPTVVDSSATVGDLAFAVLRRNVSALLIHDPGTRLGEDIEELHDMRVATRRLRAALDLFSDSLPVRAGHLRSELGWLADVLGAVRDLDVQLEKIKGWLEDLDESEREALSQLSDLLGREREHSRTALLEALDSARYERLIAGFTAMA
ncbi:MAG TPA: CHAD domain-containing protein, partial [Acidimicrobiales bacterium]|nr:CHAD domain-containing protein [Acidimicrobiales bacterium]